MHMPRKDPRSRIPIPGTCVSQELCVISFLLPAPWSTHSKEHQSLCLLAQGESTDVNSTGLHPYEQYISQKGISIQILSPHRQDVRLIGPLDLCSHAASLF